MLPYLQKFVYLKQLTLKNIPTGHMLYLYSKELDNLKFLETLKASNQVTFSYSTVDEDKVASVKNIFDKKTLAVVELKLDKIYFELRRKLKVDELNCPNLKRLSIPLHTIIDFFSVLRICPNLEYLYVELQYFESLELCIKWYPACFSASLRELHFVSTVGSSISIENVRLVIESVAQNLQCLTLSIKTQDKKFFDGQLVEHELVSSKQLPNLITFNYYVQHYSKYRFDLSEVIQSFQSSFWLKERKWPMKCFTTSGGYEIHLYTVPSRQQSLKFSYAMIDPTLSRSSTDVSKDQKETAQTHIELDPNPPLSSAQVFHFLQLCPNARYLRLYEIRGKERTIFLRGSSDNYKV